MPTTKAANYTDEQVTEMKGAYTQAESAEGRDAAVIAIAEKFGKSKRSIISKMSREGFYVKKTVVSTVTGEKPAKKEELAIQLRSVSGLPMVSAEKLNKTDLQDLIQHFKMYNEVPAEFAEENEAEQTDES
jgi:hypothetical protein